MAWHFWPALAEDDTLIVPAPPPDSFLESMRACGLRPPRFAVSGSGVPPQSGPHEFSPASFDPSARFTPFGWNRDAYNINAKRALPAPAPDPVVVKRVNSREFSLVKERENFGVEACPAWFCATSTDIEIWLKSAAPGRYVAKGNHGLAGIGQFRFEIRPVFDQKTQVEATLKTLGRLCQRMGGVVLEVEQKVLAEFGVLFRVGKSGIKSTIRVHHLLSEKDGKYSGALIAASGEKDPILDPWRKNIEESVDRIASLLCEEGYAGPVGVDMYAFEKDRRACFRSLVDLNARCSMAWPVHGLAQCFRDRAVMIQQVPSSKIFSEKKFDAMTNITNKLFFDQKTRRGVIHLTPLPALKRHSLAFVGNDVADVTGVCKTTLELLALKGKL